MIILIILAFLIVGSMLWRAISQRQVMPCPTWLGWLVELDNPFCKANRAANIINSLCLEPGMSVLDAGCGPGRLTIPIAKQIYPHGHVTAMDIQPDMLAKVQAKANAANLHNIHFIFAGIGENKSGINKFDRALLVTVLGEIPTKNQYTALNEIFNALKPGGMLSITEIIFDPHFQSQTKVLKLAQEAGFIKPAIFGKAWAFTLNVSKPL